MEDEGLQFIFLLMKVAYLATLQVSAMTKEWKCRHWAFSSTISVFQSLDHDINQFIKVTSTFLDFDHASIATDTDLDA